MKGLVHIQVSDLSHLTLVLSIKCDVLCCNSATRNNYFLIRMCEMWNKYSTGGDGSDVFNTAELIVVSKYYGISQYDLQMFDLLKYVISLDLGNVGCHIFALDEMCFDQTLMAFLVLASFLATNCNKSLSVEFGMWNFIQYICCYWTF